MSQRGARRPEIRPALYIANKEHLLELVTHSSVEDKCRERERERKSRSSD